MNEDTKQGLIWSTTAMIIVLALLFTISSCLREDNKFMQDYRLACIERGGEMALVPGKSETFYCKQKIMLR